MSLINTLASLPPSHERGQTSFRQLSVIAKFLPLDELSLPQATCKIKGTSLLCVPTSRAGEREAEVVVVQIREA